MNDLDSLAFVDESKKPVRDAATGKVADSGDHYVVAAAIVLRGEADAVRAQLRRLLEDADHDLHYSDLSPRRRIAALTNLGDIDGWEGLIYETSQPVPARQPERRTRARILSVALPDLTSGHGVQVVTLETRATPKAGFDALDQHDHSTWRSLVDRGLAPVEGRITHDSKTEPLLWIADLVAGARSDHLCGTDRRMFPYIAHRIIRIVGVHG